MKGPQIRGAATREYKNHEPYIFRIMPLPSAEIARCLYLNSVGACVLCRIVWVLTCRKQIGVPVVICVPYNPRAVPRKTVGNKLTDNTAEVRRHQRVFESRYPFTYKLGVDGLEEIGEIAHGAEHMIDGDSERDEGLGIEMIE